VAPEDSFYSRQFFRDHYRSCGFCTIPLVQAFKVALDPAEVVADLSHSRQSVDPVALIQSTWLRYPELP
jgi:hypothetical protein